ncbi:MAG: VCBS repeat-containing protein [Capsulimonadales bacterium]|nr:VCBS repeat-containing protein [Capsulimonadales bacterium]
MYMLFALLLALVLPDGVQAPTPQEPINYPASVRFLPTGAYPYHVSLADFNRDGTEDIVVACRGDLKPTRLERPANETITVYLSRGNGGYQRFDETVGFGPYTTRIADMDGDGRLDIVVANFQAADGRDLTILYGAKSGNAPFEAARHYKMEGEGNSDHKAYNSQGEIIYGMPGLTSLTIADFNRDGKPDIATVAWTSDFLYLLHNNGKRGFKQTRFVTPPGPRDIAAADFDRDGKMDVAMTLYSSNLVDVRLNDGKGFVPWRTFSSYGNIPYHLRAGDIDGDGRPDLVVGNRDGTDNVTVFHNERDRFRFAGSLPIGTDDDYLKTADEIRDVHLADVDGDGVLDLLAACHVSHKLVFWRGTKGSLVLSPPIPYGSALSQVALPPCAAFTDRKILNFPKKGPRALATTKSTLVLGFSDTDEVAVIPFAVLLAPSFP